MSNRVINTNLWDDKMVSEEFSPEDKYFWLFLLTNPKSNLLGVYRITLKEMSFYLDYSKDAISVLLDRFENRYGVIKYIDGELAIKNFLVYGVVGGGSPIRDCLLREMALIKHKELIEWCFKSVMIYSKKYNRNINTTVLDIITNYFTNNNIDISSINLSNISYICITDSYHDSPTESVTDSYHDSVKGHIPYEKIVTYLNSKTGKNYQYTTPKTQTLIKTRFKEGFTEEDFYDVISKMTEQWMGTEMEQYLRPETLFGTKFEGYLNATFKKKGADIWDAYKT